MSHRFVQRRLTIGSPFKMKRLRILLAVLTSLGLPWLAPAAERVALVIGCSNYTSDPRLHLDTPVQDARDLSAMLSAPSLGFEVIPLYDARVEDLYGGLRQFKAKAQGARVALVYFSGHGIEHEGQNYLVTVNAVLDSEDQLDTQTMNLDRVMRDLGGTGATVKVAILDCCRDNPFAQTKSWMRTKSVANAGVLRALGEAEIPQTTLVCFATSAGRKAAAVLGDHSKNSPFTQFLLDELPKPGQSLQMLFENVHDRLTEATGGRQEPTVKTDNALNQLFRKTVLVNGKAPLRSPFPLRGAEAPSRPSMPSAPITAPPPVAGRTTDFETYGNVRYAFAVDYPSGLLYPQGESDNGDGQKFLSKDGQIEVVAYGRRALDTTLAEMYDEESRGGLGINPTRVVTYKVLRKAWYVVSGAEKGKGFYDKILFDSGAFKCLRIRYPAERDEELTPIIDRISMSFRNLGSKPL